MDKAEDDGPLYTVERSDEPAGAWRVMGPNGPVGDYKSASEAQARADSLNEQVAEEAEDDS